MAKQYRLSHRTIHKNGKTGNWTEWIEHNGEDMLRFAADFDASWAKQHGKSVEFRVQSRDVSEWADCTMRGVNC